MSWKIYPVTVHTTLCLSNSVWEKKIPTAKNPPPKTNPHSKSFPNNMVYIHCPTYQIMFSDDLDERGKSLHS